MSLPRYCDFALKHRSDHPSWWFADHTRYCKECKARNAAAGLAGAREVYARLHKWRKENRVTKRARKAQKQARKANRSK